MAQQGPILVLVAHSGRTLQLDVTTTTQVALVQHALVSFTGVPVADQIAMYQGARLDPNKPLAAYGLPKDPATASVEDHPVFLYCRSYLKPGAALPPPEALPQIQVQVPPLAEVNLAHPLHAAASPMVRALPDYERHFTHHLATTRAYWDVAQARLARCRQLLSEQEVQARAADAARANVEAHYNYILAAYQNFLDKYNAQHAAHALLLSTFPADLAALEALELHPSLQSPAPGQQQGQGQAGGSASPASGVTVAAGTAGSSGAAGQAGEQQQGQGQVVVVQRRLGDLYPVARLREWADTCARSHASFGAKVGELEALFQALRRDVEALFMQAPSVDLDALGRRMTECEGLLDEHSSMVQVLSKDLRTVRALVEDVVRQLGAAGGAGSSGAAAAAGAGGGGGLKLGALHDAAAAMEAIHETHRNRVLPRLAALDSQLAEFAQAAEASKVAMSADVLGQLQRISGQQSRIRDMKNKLAAFNEVLGRQDAAFGELKAVHRLPAAYRALLAEVVRRGAWHQLYCGQAGRLAEHMTRFREKEAARRAAFGKEVARHLPTELLSRAGLAAEPPHCQVTVPPPAVPLIAVALSDLQRLSYLDERMAASSSLRAATSAAAAAGGGGGGGRPPHASHHHHHQHGHGHGRGQGRPGAGHHAQQHGSRSTAAGPAGAGAIPGTVAVLDADPPPPADPMQALEMENARLRAELANHIAAACVRELESLQQQQPTTPAAAARQQSTDSTGAPSAAAGSAAALLPQRVSSSGGGAAPPPAPASASGAASPAASPPARRDPAELVTAMQRALAMKDDLIRQQQRESATLAARAAAYEERIAALEALLARQATAPEAAAAAAAGGGGIGSGRSSAHGAGGFGAAEAVDGSVAEDGVVVERAASGPGPSPLPSGVEVVEVEVEAEAELARSAAAGQAEVEAGTEADTLTAMCGGDTSNSVELVEREEAAGAEAQEAVEAEEQEAGAGAEEAPQPPPAAGDAAAAAPVPSAPSPFALAAVQDAPQPEGPIAAAALAAAAASASAGPSATASAAPSQSASRRASFDKSRAFAAVAMEGRARTQSASVTDAASSVAAAIARHAALAPVRGSSGPQAIPGRGGGGGGNGGGGGGGPSAGGASPGGAGRYGGSCMPMAIGSLPFATSLPASSLLPGSVIPGGAGGRLDASPSGGIGLGLALGFGLGPLTESTDRRQRSGAGQAGGGAGGAGGSAATAETAAARGGSEEDEVDGAGAQSARSSLDGGSISASGSFCRAHSAAAEEDNDERRRAAEEAEGARRGGGDGDDSPVGGSSSSSSGLQFRPSWSGTPAVARASEPAGGEPGQSQGQDATGHDDGVAQEQAPLSLAGAMEQAAADNAVGEETAGNAAAAATDPGAQGAAEDEDDVDDVDDAEAPDIDEVIDSGGAWEVAAPEGAMELAQEEGEDEEERQQAGSGGSGPEAALHGGAAAEQASSGYETVGSV